MWNGAPTFAHARGLALRTAVGALALAVLAASACAPTPPRVEVNVPLDTSRDGALAAASDETGDPGPVPVTDGDPQWGSRDALVTVVEFADFQCAFSRRAAKTLAELRSRYGPDDLRIVWKHHPLSSIHPLARAAHEIAATAFDVRGSKGFWAFYDAVYLTDRAFSVELYKDAGIAAGVKGGDVLAHVKRSNEKIDADLALGQKVGISGTPHFFVNGVEITGAQPVAEFVAVIDPELAKARALSAAGVPRGRMYAVRTLENFKKAEAQPKPKSEEAEDAVLWRVPIGRSPTRGNPAAPVTIVEFGDFQCPFCAKVQPTLEAVHVKYGDRVRFVFKDEPLPFHKNAMPAALVGREVRARRGDAAFWRFHDAVYADQGHIEPSDLDALASSLGLPGGTTKVAQANAKLRADVEADMELAEDVTATGTPTFFVNGRKLTGAQPVDKFVALVDEELAKADAWTKRGNSLAGYYDALMKTAKQAELPPRVVVPPPTSANPSRGPANARVVIDYFSDFQCPFCKRVEGTLADLEKEFPGQIKIVWRNDPLPFHADAGPAAEAAMEAFAQRGAKGFWAMHDVLFTDKQRLDRAGLEQAAQRVGLDMKRFANALDQHTHAAEIEADKAVGTAVKVGGTPAFFINGYFVNGAQPLSKFRRVVRLALTPPAQTSGSAAP